MKKQITERSIFISKKIKEKFEIKKKLKVWNKKTRKKKKNMKKNFLKNNKFAINPLTFLFISDFFSKNYSEKKTFQKLKKKFEN